MKKPALILVFFGILFTISCTNKSQSPPNILFIAIDDLKPTLGCYGDETTISPNIDELASRGVVFLNNHCQQAICGPSRASLLTGMYPDENQVWEFCSIRERNQDVVMLPQHFKNNGYTTVNISKIFDYRTVDKGMDTISWSWPYFPNGGKENAYLPKGIGPVAGYFYQSEKVKKVFNEKIAYTQEHGGDPNQLTHQIIKPATECLDLPDNAYKDGIFALKAMEDLETLSGEENPFFLAVGFERPHLPFTAPKKYWDMYDREAIELEEYQEIASNDKEYFYSKSNELQSYTAEDGEDIYGKLDDGIPLTDDEQRQLIHGYKAAVTYIDVQVGMILSKLDELGLRENTIVVIWGDHGWHLGDHGLWCKQTNFEQATRSPLIISVPGNEHRETKQATEFVDLFPTLCELAGIPQREDLSGTSLLKVMDGKEDPLNAYAFSQYPRGNKMGYTIRDGRYRYVKWMEEGRHVNLDADYSVVADTQLFDYEKDPLETINVSGMDDYKDIEVSLEKALDEWLATFTSE
jgi:iduronate 2-sulfatase